MLALVAAVNLEEGLPLEAKDSPDFFAGILIGLFEAMDVGRQSSPPMWCSKKKTLPYSYAA
jgi:hypothetical protein